VSGDKTVLQVAALDVTVCSMKTVTMKMPEELALRLERQAKRLGVSKSEVLRQSLERTFDEGGVDELSAHDLMREGCGCVDGGVTDLATNPKHLEGLGR
jgi:predicted DNA-binding protein